MTEPIETGPHSARINAFIDTFSQEVSRALGQEMRFPSLDASGVSRLSRGSANIEIHVYEASGELLLLSRIMPAPQQDRAACCQYLLELNFAATAEAAFAIDRDTDTICLRTFRSLEGLDYEEFETLLQSIGATADEWDDRLKERFAP
ncbi:MAG: YbjN domain-containing protein [Proteobacteria bacterium]|nr:YbjN domain-containing protein [Pseudomonadota bacterium]